MKTHCHLICCSALLALTAPLTADPPGITPPSPTQQSVLDGLAGKHQVIGFTERGGRRFLGRVLSGDHGLYVVQTFHYVSAPATETVTTEQTTLVPGRSHRYRPQTKQVKTRETTQTTISDDAAVRALLSGVAGASFRPAEQPAQREIVAQGDVLCVQQLSPPPAGTASWTLKTLWAAPDLKPAAK